MRIVLKQILSFTLMNLKMNKAVIFQFLNRLDSKEEIHSVIDHLISKIALKFDEDEEQLSDFIFYALNP